MCPFLHHSLFLKVVLVSIYFQAVPLNVTLALLALALTVLLIAGSVLACNVTCGRDSVSNISFGVVIIKVHDDGA